MFKSKSQLEKLNAQDLKQLAKDYGIVQSGDKLTLVHRINMYQTLESDKLYEHSHIISIPSNPCKMKMGELKGISSKYGISPIGTQDEILTELVEKLKQLKPSTAMVSSTTSSSKKDDSIKKQSIKASSINHQDPIAIARRILELDELDGYEEILSLGLKLLNDPSIDPVITKDTSITVMRRSYLKLSLMIHPDKLSSYPDATKAFQALVTAFETLFMRPSYDSSTTDSSHMKTSTAAVYVRSVGRSNENCYKTHILCPKCKQCWTSSLSLDGNPTYVYNFMMMGLKQYHCSTCLFLFGCMTAIHLCPYCNESYEYNPSEYHHQVTCRHISCIKKFGYMMYVTSDRVMKEMKIQIHHEQAQRIASTEAKRRRKQRSLRYNVSLSMNEEEQAYLIGLRDSCPRCGYEFDYTSLDHDNIIPDPQQHLLSCNDKKIHQQYQQHLRDHQRKLDEMEHQQSKQSSVMSYASWEFLGSKMNQIWMLEDDQLHQIAAKHDILISQHQSINKYQLIQHIISSTSSALTTSSHDHHKRDKKKRKRLSFDDESLPSNFYSMSLDQLLSICASHDIMDDIDIHDNITKDEVIAHIESYVYANANDHHRLSSSSHSSTAKALPS